MSFQRKRSSAGWSSTQEGRSEAQPMSDARLGQGLLPAAERNSLVFRQHSSRTMTVKCRRWRKMQQGENMPVSLKTQAERTAKTPATARRARVGGLCGFPDTAERVPAESPKTGRCTAVRERCRNAKRRKRTAAGGFRQREKPQAAKQEKGLTLFCVWPSTSARSAGSFGG